MTSNILFCVCFTHAKVFRLDTLTSRDTDGVSTRVRKYKDGMEGMLVMSVAPPVDAAVADWRLGCFFLR